MDSLVLQVLFLESLLHLEIGLTLAFDSLLLVITDDTSVHGLNNVRGDIFSDGVRGTDGLVLLLRKMDEGNNANCGRASSR